MTAMVYPVAATAEAALHAPSGFATRASEAQTVAARPVVFATEPMGPAFPSREAAQAAYGAGRGASGLAQGWARLTPVAGDAVSPPLPVRPVYSKGRRWPEQSAAAHLAHWRLWVSYWRVSEVDAANGNVSGEGAGGESAQAARRLRRSADGRALGADALSALAHQPLRPVRPQQPLEIGLFEARRPEAPDLIIPDE